MPESTIVDNYRRTRERVEEALHRSGRSSGSVTIVAVSKKHSLDRIRAAIDGGILDLGENRAGELEEKADMLGSGNENGADVRWHMVGHLQSNKVKRIIEVVHCIHSVDRLSLASEIDSRSKSVGRQVDCLIQINISDEDQKSGLGPGDFPEFLQQCESLDSLNVTGLMGMAEFTDDMDVVRRQFARLRELRDRHASHLTHLSMGMTNDFEVAIEEGATIVRVGTTIFGPRSG